jgi:agmatinase
MIKLLGIPYDEHSSYQRGAAEAPELIRQAVSCPSGNMWTELGVDLGEEGVLEDCGDIKLEDGPQVFEHITTAMLQQIQTGKPVIALGGDHAITYPLVKAVSKQYPVFSILHFDSHSDLYDIYEGDRLSHACPFARIMEEGLVRHLVQVGIHTMNGHCRQQAARFGVEVMEMKDFRDDWLPEFDTPVYLSFDMDGLDPAFAPGVSHREPGGLNIRQVLRLIHKLKAPIIAADIVEFNPRRDQDGVTAMVSARLLKEIAGKMVLERK